MTLFNFLTDNSLVFYSLFTGTVGFMGYKLCKSIWDNSGSISDLNSISISVYVFVFLFIKE